MALTIELEHWIYDTQTELWFEWNGSMTVNVYRTYGQSRDTWTNVDVYMSSEKMDYEDFTDSVIEYLGERELRYNA